MPCKCWEVSTGVPWKILRSCKSWVVTAQTSQQKYTRQEYTHTKETPHPHPSYSIVFYFLYISTSFKSGGCTTFEG